VCNDSRTRAAVWRVMHNLQHRWICVEVAWTANPTWQGIEASLRLHSGLEFPMSAAAGTGGPAPIKILLVGPSKSRKSPLACMLAGQCDAITAINPGPTVGVRILELDRSGVAVELWDVAGDQSYEATWPAVMKDADGVLLVYNPEAPAAAVRCLHVACWLRSQRVRSGNSSLLRSHLLMSR